MDWKKFWDLVVDVWQKGVYGIDIGKILLAFSIFVGFMLFRGLFTRFVLWRIRAWTEKTETKIDDEVIEALERPLYFVPLVLGVFFATEYLELVGVMAWTADKIVRSLVIFTIFWSFIRLVQPLSFVLSKLEDIFSISMVQWVIKTIRLVLLLIGTASILELWGIKVGPIIAGLGLFGVAVALGAQDLFKNLISGILILGEKRFLPGNWIKVEGLVEGTVESINFRSTLVRRFDKAPVYVPNAQLSDGAVTNFSAMTHRRIYWTIGVEYRTTIEQLRTIRDQIDAYIRRNEAFATPSEVPTFVRIDSFGPSSIDIMLYCFTKTTNWGEWLAIKEQLAYAIKAIVEGAGTAFAFPSRSVYVETMPEGAPEVFVPPSS